MLFLMIVSLYYKDKDVLITIRVLHASYTITELYNSRDFATCYENAN